MFGVNSTARADMKPGTFYAVCGENDWVYYGQVGPDRRVGFFRYRDRGGAAADQILGMPLMAVIVVSIPSITSALRRGIWKKLGRLELAEGLSTSTPIVQWPVGTLDVTVWIDGKPEYDTRVDDPAIQRMELMAVWDADDHIPARLTVDFEQEKSGGDIGGPIFRERKLKEEAAARFPDQPWHELPKDWVPTSVR